MGIFPTDIPIDTSGANADRWMFHMSEPLTGHHVGAILDEGKSVEPVSGKILRRIAGGMGSSLIGAMRVDGGEPFEVGDCSGLRPSAEEPAPEEPSADVTPQGDALVDGAPVTLQVDPIEGAELAPAFVEDPAVGALAAAADNSVWRDVPGVELESEQAKPQGKSKGRK